jgi:hypothetical protein
MGYILLCMCIVGIMFIWGIHIVSLEPCWRGSWAQNKYLSPWPPQEILVGIVCLYPVFIMLLTIAQVILYITCTKLLLAISL